MLKTIEILGSMLSEETRVHVNLKIAEICANVFNSGQKIKDFEMSINPYPTCLILIAYEDSIKRIVLIEKTVVNNYNKQYYI